MREELVGLVEMEITGEQTYECSDLVDGALGVLTDFLALETQHQHAVEGIEAGFYLSGLILA